MDKISVSRTDNDLAVAQEQRIRFVDLPDSEPEKFNKGKFTEILLNMKGNRTIRDFALETDLSESFVSKAVNGFIDRPPSKRTMMKLLSAKSKALVNRRELVESAGYAAEQIDWDHTEIEDTAPRKVSASEAITRYYGESDFLACGNLIKTLSEHGVDGNISSYFYRDEGFFEVKDEMSGQVYVGINLYCNPETSEENAVLSLVFSLALTYNKILKTDNVKDKIVVIMTNNEKIYEGCQTLNFDQLPKATLVVLFADDHTEVQREAVLSGNSPVSLLD